LSGSWFNRRSECPACASKSFRTLYQSPYDAPPLSDYLEAFYAPPGMVEPECLEGASYILCECNVCRLIFQQEIPGDMLLERIYDRWIAPTPPLCQRQFHDDLNYHASHAQEIMRVIAYFGEPPSSLRFLDFGMGWGEWAVMAKAFGCECYGTELSRVRIEWAGSRGIRVLTWDEIPQHRFAFINTEQVFEHLTEPLQTLIHLKSALRSDGLIKISVPTAHNMGRRLRIMDWRIPKGSRNSLNPVAPLEHLNFYRRSSLLKMASKSGMEEVVIPLKVQYQFATNWRGMKRVAKNFLLPLYRNLLRKQNCVLLRRAEESSVR
jgi:2-polyprenyl-3-methyl-5-hydroxy-6-metoxy-1,4-benzoquinol methylase